MRIDKFLWCVRLTKTRSQATRLCNNGRVMLDGEITKPSKIVYASAKIKIKSTPIWRCFKVIEIPASRVGAKLVSTLMIETTPEKDLEQLELILKANRTNQQLGIKGRPTKKDRRKLDGLQD